MQLPAVVKPAAAAATAAAAAAAATAATAAANANGPTADETVVEVTVPPTRSDILHACDVMEVS